MSGIMQFLSGVFSLALFLSVGFSAAAQQLATENPLFGQSSVGNASIVVKTVTGSLDGSVTKLRLQDDIYHNELIETFEESATELAFLDETTINLGPNSSIVLDEFVYDPDPSNSSSFSAFFNSSSPCISFISLSFCSSSNSLLASLSSSS